jgi:hypothetical protein
MQVQLGITSPRMIESALGRQAIWASSIGTEFGFVSDEVEALDAGRPDLRIT